MFGVGSIKAQWLVREWGGEEHWTQKHQVLAIYTADR